MFKALNTAASGLAAQSNNMEVISNNISNMGTTGFKKSRAEFEDLMYQTIKEPGAASGLNAQSPTGVQTGLGVKTAATQREFSMGPAITTKQPLDMQIEGPGFFQVVTPDGEVAFTRDGSFRRDVEGRIVDKNGSILQPEITIPSNASAINIAADGAVSVVLDPTQPPQAIGQIDLVNFVNSAGLKAVGRNLFVQTPASGQPIQSRPGLQGVGFIAQGQLEGSNVNIADEMVNMITAQRLYETNSKAIQAADQMLQTINSLR